MKINRQDELKRLAQNINIERQNSGEKVLAITTDNSKFNIGDFVNELGVELAKKLKVLVVSYEEVTKVESLNYLELEPTDEDLEKIEKDIEEYDIVLLVVPNILTSQAYLHAKQIAKSIIIVAKRWVSKTAQIKEIKAALEESEIKIRGLIYQK